MVRPKYRLSKAGMDELMDRLSRLAIQQSEEVEGLSEAQITTGFLEKVTKVEGIEDVIERNEHLSKAFQGLLNMYGFDSMYDMYMYAMSCDSNILYKSRKDYSKLVPVKRKVVRNGKEIEVTIYEDPDKDNREETEGEEGSGSSGAPVRRHARDLKSKMVDDTESKNPKNIAKLKTSSKKLKQGNKPFSDTSDFYFTILDDDGIIVGIVGYSVEGEYLVMDFYRSNGQVAGVAARGFFQLMRLAVEKGKGVKVEDNQQARPVFMKSGLEQKGDNWVISAEDLRSAFGGSSD